MAQSGLWFIALIALLAPGLTAFAVASDAETSASSDPPTLHLRGERDGESLYRNYTAEAPQNDTPLHVEPCEVELRGQAHWCWQMHRAPLPWTLEAGAEVQTILHFANLDRVPLGLAQPDDPTQSGRLRIDAVLTKGSYHEAARGTAYIDPSVLADATDSRVTITMQAEQKTQWNITPGDAPAVELQIHLHGLVRRDDPPTIMTGAVETDSRLLLPGFPLDEFEAWEATETANADCLERIARQETCNEADPDPTGNGTRPLSGANAEAPVQVLPFLLVLLAAGLIHRRRRQAA